MDTVNRILELIQILGFKNQTEFLKELELSHTVIARWKKGHKIDPLVLNLIESKYNVSRDWLRNGEGEMFIEPQHDKASKRHSQRDIFIISALESGMVSEADKDFVIKFLQEKQELAELRSKTVKMKKEGTNDS